MKLNNPKVSKIKTKVELIHIDSNQHESRTINKQGVNVVYSSRSIDALKRRKSLEENQEPTHKKYEANSKTSYNTNQIVASRFKANIPVFSKPKAENWRTQKFRLERKTENLSLIHTDKNNTVVCTRSHSEENETNEVPQYDENLSGFIKLPRRKSTKSMKHCGISKERGSSLVKINKIENKYQACFRAHKRINLLDNDSSSDEDDSFKMTIQQVKKESIKKKKLKDYKIQTKPSKECCKFVILTKIDLSDNNTPLNEKETSSSKRVSYPITKQINTSHSKLTSARSGNLTSTTSNSSSQERGMSKAQRCFSERKDHTKDQFDYEKFRSVNLNRSGLNGIKTSSCFKLIELLDNDKPSRQDSKTNPTGKGKHIRRYKSITESSKTESNLEAKIEAAKIIAKESKISFEKEIEIHNFEEYPSYIGYYFRKAYSQAYESLRCSVNASLHDPFDSNRMTLEDFSRNTFQCNVDLRSSTSKIDMENHKTIENPIYSKLPVYQFNIDELNINKEEIKELPIQSQEMIRSNEEHVVTTLQSLEYVSHIKAPEHSIYLSGKEAIYKTDQRKLLVLDMDETIIHTLYKKNRDKYGRDETNLTYDAQVPIINPDGSTRYLYINIRPYVKEVLKELK